jgi:hypothetical protein
VTFPHFPQAFLSGKIATDYLKLIHLTAFTELLEVSQPAGIKALNGVKKQDVDQSQSQNYPGKALESELRQSRC